MKKTTLVTAALFAALTIFPVAAHLALAQDDPCLTSGFGGVYDESVGTCRADSQIDLKIAYPLALVNENPLIKQTIDQFMQEQRAEFFAPFTNDLFYPVPNFFFQIDYTPYRHSEAVRSILFTISEYTGGAHPNTFYRTFSFDLAGNRILAVTDLFQPGVDAWAVITPMVEASLTEQQGDYADASWIDGGTGSNPDNYADFALDADNLYFFFSPYQVAPYAAGAFTVTLPLSGLSSILAPEFQRARG